ncbi:hypothetical protein EDWATA_00318 [Edwardsiella tarda ATCC 23685]|uniref:Uncharacterized protein n=1 Tax=Edwardsiella tarda ATCC 23685 TaxID=500638 RepID=D4F0T8_EDWTA|nr:hypothetical protein EDWATA_00318 [Edwardsiella tarda ATCC 23685]
MLASVSLPAVHYSLKDTIYQCIICILRVCIKNNFTFCHLCR